ncbi:MAG: LacI family DNA-binding transcriptional regulator [Flavihumibacter sp.]
MKRTSLKDIAERVGVSTALVSYVLNNKKEGRIGKAIAARIRETAQAMNYRTNQIAKSLKTNKTMTIGLVLADISNPFSSAIARVIEDAANELRYTVLFGSSDENAGRFRRLVDIFRDHQVDGLILLPPNGVSEDIRRLYAQRVPFVQLDRYYPASPGSVVALDNFAAAMEGTALMLSKGRQKIGLIAFETQLYHLHQRKLGYQQAHQQLGLTPDPALVVELGVHHLEKTVPAAIDNLLGKGVDGLLFVSNTLSAIALRHLNQLPVRVPDDLSVVSFDENELLDLFYAPLTYLRQPLQEMGRKAVELLLSSMENPQQISRVHFPATLVKRRSA